MSAQGAPLLLFLALPSVACGFHPRVYEMVAASADIVPSFQKGGPPEGLHQPTLLSKLCHIAMRGCSGVHVTQ